MSKILLKTLRLAILPAATMVVAKLIGTYIAVQFYNIDIFISNDIGLFFSVQLNVATDTQAMQIESISNTIMLIIMTISSSYIFIKYSLYQMSKDSPQTIVKLTKLNLLKWVTDKHSVFLKVFVWTIFLLTTSAIVITSALNSRTTQWIGAVAFVITIISMWSLVRTFEVETARIYPKEHSYT